MSVWEKLVIHTWHCTGETAYGTPSGVPFVFTREKGIEYFTKTGTNTIMIIMYPPGSGFIYGTTDIDALKDDVDYWTSLGYKVLIAPYMPDIGEYDLEKIRGMTVAYLDYIPNAYGLSPTGLGVRGGASPTREENLEWIHMVADECNARGKFFMISIGDWQINVANDTPTLASWGVTIWAPFPGWWQSVYWDAVSGAIPECWAGSDPTTVRNWYPGIWASCGYPRWDHIRGIVWWTTLTSFELTEAMMAEMKKCSEDFLDIAVYPKQPTYYPDQPELSENFDALPVGSTPGWGTGYNDPDTLSSPQPTVTDSTSISPPNSLKYGVGYKEYFVENIARGHVRITAEFPPHTPYCAPGLVAWYRPEGDPNGVAIFTEFYYIFYNPPETQNGVNLHVGAFHWSYNLVASAFAPFNSGEAHRERMEVSIEGYYPKMLLHVKFWLARAGEEFPTTPLIDYTGSIGSFGLLTIPIGGQCGIYERGGTSDRLAYVDNVNIESLAPTPPPPPDINSGTWNLISGSWYTPETSKLMAVAEPLKDAAMGYGNIALTDFTVETTITLADTSTRCAGLYFRYVDPNNYYYFRYGAHDGLFMIYKMIGGVFESAGPALSGELSPNIPHVFKVTIQGWHVQCYVDDELKIETDLTGQELASGGIGYEVYNDTTAIFENPLINGEVLNYPSLEPPSHPLTVNSTPFSGVPFTIDGASQVTPYTETLEEKAYVVNMPSNIKVGEDVYNFKDWEDYSTNPIRNINLITDLSITANYEYVTPPPEKAYLQVHAYLNSEEISAEGTIIETGETFITPTLIEVSQGTYTIKVSYQGKEQTKTADVTEGQTLRVDFQFLPKPPIIEWWNSLSIVKKALVLSPLLIPVVYLIKK